MILLPVSIFLAFFLPAASPAADEPEVKNIILISMDSVRADHLSIYGYPRKTTPVLEAFVAKHGGTAHPVGREYHSGPGLRRPSGRWPRGG